MGELDTLVVDALVGESVGEPPAGVALGTVVPDPVRDAEPSRLGDALALAMTVTLSDDNKLAVIS